MKVPSRLGLPLALALLSAVAAYLPLLALPAAIAVFLGFVVASRGPAETRRVPYLILGLAALVATFAVVRFLKTKAIAGIVQGGTRAAETRAVSRLREILFAEDVMRRHARWDPDGDAVGSAALLGELSGELGLRGGVRLVPPVLEGIPKSEATSIGPAHLVAGYWFAVCLPTRDGSLSADPGAAFDDELAERRFLAYAWPASERLALGHAFALDQHERILVAPARTGQRTGFQHAPRCDDAVAPATRQEWRPWQGKQPRASLPGDRAG